MGHLYAFSKWCNMDNLQNNNRFNRYMQNKYNIYNCYLHNKTFNTFSANCFDFSEIYKKQSRKFNRMIE